MQPSNEPEEMQKADPRARRQALLIIACALVAGAILIPAAEANFPALAAWISQDTGARLVPAIAAFYAITLTPVLGFAIYFWRIGARIAAAARFPAPGARVARDTVVLHGRAAVQRGRVVQILAVALLFAAAGLCGLLWRLQSLLRDL